MKNSKYILRIFNYIISSVVILALLFSCGSRKVDKQKTKEETTEVKQEEKEQETEVATNNKEFEKTDEKSGSFNFQLIPSLRDTVYEDRIVYVKDRQGNELKTKAHPGDELFFGSDFFLSQKLKITEQQKDSISRVNYNLAAENKSLKSKLDKQTERQPNYLYPIIIIIVLALCLWLLFRNFKSRSRYL